VDYGRVYFEGCEVRGEGCEVRDKGCEVSGERCEVSGRRDWQRFFYEPTDCAACEGWRICMGKYAALEDKSGCQSFMVEFLNTIENLKPDKIQS